MKKFDINFEEIIKDDMHQKSENQKQFIKTLQEHLEKRFLHYRLQLLMPRPMTHHIHTYILVYKKTILLLKKLAFHKILTR